MSLYCGFDNFYAKVDLATDHIDKFQLNELISCFSFNHKINYYLVGTYSKNIFIMDNKFNKPINVLKYHCGGINTLLYLNENNFVSGARADDEVLMWDIRNLKVPSHSFYRNNPTHQKINITSCKDRILFCGNHVIYIIIEGWNNFGIQPKKF